MERNHDDDVALLVAAFECENNNFFALIPWQKEEENGWGSYEEK